MLRSFCLAYTYKLCKKMTRINQVVQSMNLDELQKFLTRTTFHINRTYDPSDEVQKDIQCCEDLYYLLERLKSSIDHPSDGE